MPKNLKRYYGKGDLHFITFSCFRRLALLGTARARNVFVRALGEVRKKYGIAVVGYVVMPEHVHLLIGESKKGTPSSVVHSLKLRVSKRMRRGRRKQSASQRTLPFREGERELPQFWQKRFYDFNVWRWEKKKGKLNNFTRDRKAVNMHANPVKRKLVRRPQDWPWSSYSFYSSGEAGLMSVNAVD